MEFIDLGAQQSRIGDKIDARIHAVLSHGQYIMGPEVSELEERLAAYVGVKHAIACASDTGLANTCHGLWSATWGHHLHAANTAMSLFASATTYHP